MARYSQSYTWVKAVFKIFDFAFFMKFGKDSHLSATDVIRILLMGPKQGLVPTLHYCANFFGESRRALLPVSYLIYSLKRHLNIQCNVSVLSSLQGQTVFKS